MYIAYLKIFNNTYIYIYIIIIEKVSKNIFLLYIIIFSNTFLRNEKKNYSIKITFNNN